MGFFQTFWSWLNATLTGYIGNNTARVANALEPAIITLSTIYLMGWGYLQLTGRTEEALATGIKRIVVLVIVLGVALHLWLYNTLIVDVYKRQAKNPELVIKGDTAYTRFCLIGNDYAGKDDGGAAREVATSLWFVAFGPLGEAIAKNSRKGDQLVLEARIRANNWTDQQGEKQYDYSFIVDGFRFGAPGKAKREELETRREEGPALDAVANLG